MFDQTSMKTRYLTICMLFVSAVVAQASVTIQLDAGVLRDANGNTFTGGMLQLIAERSTSTAFAVPTANSFVGGDTANEVVLANFAFNQGGTGFVTGETSNVITFNFENTTAQNSTTTFDPGDALLLRWYPTLTLGTASPGAGTSYGQYRSSNPPNGGIAWFAPTDGSNLTIPNGLNFLTNTAGGANPDSAGVASSTVAVPEPSSVVLEGSIAIGLVIWTLRRRCA